MLLRIGMIGAGTVGGGVYELIEKYCNDSMIVTKICVQSLHKERLWLTTTSSGNHTTIPVITTNPSDIYNDPTIDCIVEVMGGTTMAHEVVIKSLNNRKHVVTANKALLAEYLDRIHETVRNNQVLFGYEASVCGGIPIIQLLRTTYLSDTITSIVGICNGTTNYMLTAMMDKHNTISYKDALQTAQQLGYAESDPTADVDGHDVRSKIAILAKLAYGTTILNPSSTIPCKGIRSLTNDDLQYAKNNDYTIKLLGVACTTNTTTPDDDDDSSSNTNTNTTTTSNTSLAIYVTPVFIPIQHILAGINGCGNCVAVTSQNMGLCTYAGPGAGRYPTANSIVSDLWRIRQYQQQQQQQTTLATTTTTTNDNSTTTTQKHIDDPFPIRTNQHTTPITLNCNYKAVFYIRVNIVTSSSSLLTNKKILQDLFVQHAAQMYNIQINPIPLTNDEDVIYMTTAEDVLVQTMEQWLKDVQQQQQQQLESTNDENNNNNNNCLIESYFFMPILS